MSCWVAPTVAAELWGCTVESIWSAIREGRLVTRIENGWTFIDAMPDASASAQLPRAMCPPTFSAVSQAELAALSAPFQLPEEDTKTEDAFAMLDDSSMAGDWREVRSRTATLRRPPASAHAA